MLYQVMLSIVSLFLFFFITLAETFTYNEVVKASQHEETYNQIIQNSENGILLIGCKNKNNIYTKRIFQNKFLDQFADKIYSQMIKMESEESSLSPSQNPNESNNDFQFQNDQESSLF